MLTDQPRISDRRDGEIAQYKSVCATAVLGLLLGLLAPLAILNKTLLAVPLLGIVVCGVALWRIARNPAGLVGRKAAIVGLILSCLFAASTSSHRRYGEWLLSREAEQFASIWLKQMAENRPYSACQLFLNRDERRVIDDKLEDFYLNHPKLRHDMDEQYLGRPHIAELLALGSKAKVRSVRTMAVVHKPQLDYVIQVYTISYPDGDEQATLPLQLSLERKQHADATASWKIVNVIPEPSEEL